MLFLILAVVIRLLWNALARDFPALPVLTFKRALAAVLLLSMLLAVVLTMIAGAASCSRRAHGRNKGKLIV